MKNKENEKLNKYSVFLSYASEDKDIAQKIADELCEKNIMVWFDQYKLKNDVNLDQTIKKAISGSNYIIFLFSPNFDNSNWAKKEFEIATRQSTMRDIMMLPVIISGDYNKIFIERFGFIDLRTDFEKGMYQLTRQIKLISEIDFSLLGPKNFENLLTDLLLELGFVDIDHEVMIGNKCVDLNAIYPRIDPFGKKIQEKWIFEIKFYKNSRADIKSLKQLLNYISLLPENYKGAVVTNSKLTSEASKWLKAIESKDRVQIRVIDGTELKRLILKQKKLIDKYFQKENPENVD